MDSTYFPFPDAILLQTTVLTGTRSESGFQDVGQYDRWHYMDAD